MFQCRHGRRGEPTFLYLLNDLYASNTLCGLYAIVAVSLEVPLYFLALQILRAYPARNKMLSAAVAFAVRTHVTANARGPWTVVAAEGASPCDVCAGGCAITFVAA